MKKKKKKKRALEWIITGLIKSFAYHLPKLSHSKWPLCSQLELWVCLSLERSWKQPAKRFCMQGREGELGNSPSLCYSWSLWSEAFLKGRRKLIFKMHDLMSHWVQLIWYLRCEIVGIGQKKIFSRSKSLWIRFEFWSLYTDWRSSFQLSMENSQFNEEFSGQNYHARVHQQVAMCPGLIIRKVAWNPILLLFFPKINITKLVGCALDLKKKKSSNKESSLASVYLYLFFFLNPVLTSALAHASIQG